MSIVQDRSHQITRESKQSLSKKGNYDQRIPISLTRQNSFETSVGNPINKCIVSRKCRCIFKGVLENKKINQCVSSVCVGGEGGRREGGGRE